MEDATKRCTKCAEAKPLTEFGQAKRVAGMVPHSYCKDCYRAYHREYHRANLSAPLKVQRERAAVSGTCTACGKAPAESGVKSCARCLEAARAKAKRWRDANRERSRKLDRARYAADAERQRQRAQAARAKPGYADYARRKQAERRADPAFLAMKRNWQNARRAREVASVILPFSQEQLAQRLAYYGDRCWICGGPGEQVDHVKPLSKGGAHCLANLRPACFRCNNKKRATWPLSQEVLQSLRSP